MSTNAYGIFVGEIPTPTRRETTTKRQLVYVTSQRNRGNFRLRKGSFLSKGATSAKPLPKSIAQYSTRQISRWDQRQADRKPFSISTNSTTTKSLRRRNSFSKDANQKVMFRRVIKWSRGFQSLFIIQQNFGHTGTRSELELQPLHTVM